MSRLTDLIRRVKASDPETGKELEREFKTLSARLPFGLNFERHNPETVELPGRPVRKGDKVRILPARGSNEKADRRLYRVLKIKRADGNRVAVIERAQGGDDEACEVPADDLIVVAEFRDYIYPGLVSTGKVERGGADKPFHTVINAENFHALEALTFTHRGKIDAIYIDPPYNTGARDWKYNNDYVEGEDIYRHSKWLAMMERRLLVAKELLNPDDSVLIVTIDEKEYLRLGLLLEQMFPEARQTMVTSAINFAGSGRVGSFARSAEYLYFLAFGAAAPTPQALDSEWNPVARRTKYELRWDDLPRSGDNGRRLARPNLFYPVFIRQTSEGPVFSGVGEPYYGDDRERDVVPESGSVAVWPIRKDGTEATWNVSHNVLPELIRSGYVRIGRWRGSKTWLSYLKSGSRKKVEDGLFKVVGRNVDGSIVTDGSDYVARFVPTDVWRLTSHDAGNSGSHLIRRMLPNRRFPFPKSLYAVEDALRFFVANKPHAVILDFFSGSGTTAHAVMRLNKQDGGRRQCISVTNNEVAADEQKKLREQGLRPGDADWEKWGICDYITKPRIEAAITGKTPDGEPIKGDYKFTDEFPMADGFEENAEFFTLTYETPVAVGHNHSFSRIAPLLWLRAGSCGARIDKLPEAGWAVVENYGLLTDLDQAGPFEKAIEAGNTVRIAYIVTDDERRFQAIAKRLPHTVEPVRLYEAYLTNFRFAIGR